MICVLWEKKKNSARSLSVGTVSTFVSTKQRVEGINGKTTLNDGLEWILSVARIVYIPNNSPTSDSSSFFAQWTALFSRTTAAEMYRYVVSRVTSSQVD